MRFENNFNADQEDQLASNFDTFLKESASYSFKTENHYDIEMEDLDKEYDENDWEEEENYEKESGEHGTFIM